MNILINLIGIVASILNVYGVLTQYLQARKTKSTKDISANWLKISLTASTCWIIYAVYKDNYQLWIGCLCLCTLFILILNLKRKYG